MTTIKDNTKCRFDGLEGGDIFTCKIKGEDELCLKLDHPVVLKDNTLEANAVLLLTGELVNIIDGKCSIRHQNVTVEIN